MPDIEERIAKMERQFKAFTIRGSGIDVHGSMRHGFIITGAGGSGEGGGGGGPPATGACCVGTDCSVTTEADCMGAYQGDGTVCAPNPCGTIACCQSAALLCEDLTRTDCTAAGGYWPYDFPDPVGMTCAEGVCCLPSYGLPSDITAHTVSVTFTITGCASASGTASLPFSATFPGSWYAWRTFEGQDWTVADVGDYCGINTYTNLNITSPSQFQAEISGIQYGTIGGNTGWFVVTFAEIFSGWCGDPGNTDFDYTLYFLGASLSGTIIRTNGPYTVQWDISYL